jgi:hypothetical protein
VRARITQLLCGIFISTVVIAPLNETDAKFPSSGPPGIYAVAPFKPVMSSENIIIGGAAPNEHQWDLAIGSRRAILDELIKAGHFNKLVGFLSFWRNKKPSVFLSIIPYSQFSSSPVTSRLVGSAASYCLKARSAA